MKYDEDGNMIYGPLGDKMVNFTYDARNRLIQAGSTTYLYDPENNRIGKIENGQKTTYVVNANTSLSQVLMEKKGDQIRSYIYGLGLIMHVEGGEYATCHYDYRGSTVAITNSKGKVTDTFTYGPYAELIGRTGKSDISFLFNGRDGVITDANGLYYMRARYYNPTIKRFINQDVIQGSLDNAISLNRFAYANGNPVSYIDPFGLSASSGQGTRKLREVESALEKEREKLKALTDRPSLLFDDNYLEHFKPKTKEENSKKVAELGKGRLNSAVEDLYYDIQGINNTTSVVARVGNTLMIGLTKHGGVWKKGAMLADSITGFLPYTNESSKLLISIEKAFNSNANGVKMLTGARTVSTGNSMLNAGGAPGQIARVAGAIATLTVPIVESKNSFDNIYADDLYLIQQYDPENYEKAMLHARVGVPLDAMSFGYVRSAANTIPVLRQLATAEEPQWTVDWINFVNKNVNIRYSPKPILEGMSLHMRRQGTPGGAELCKYLSTYYE